jgi:hypothetical protein
LDGCTAERIDRVIGRSSLIVTDPEEAAPQIVIEMVDLHELARINPLAWEQILHIADSRILKARISVLENGNAHEDLILTSNG